MRILLNTWLLPVRRTLGWSAMALFWLPTLLGFLFAHSDLMFLGGGLGFTIDAHLSTWLGRFGAGALILFALGAFVVFTFNPSFEWVMALFGKKKAEGGRAEELKVEEAGCGTACAWKWWARRRSKVARRKRPRHCH